MALMNLVYRTAFQRTSTFAFVIMGGAFVFERIFDQAVDSFYEYHNRGVSIGVV